MVAEVRARYGDLVVMIEVAAFITTMSFFASADTSAAARAFGVRMKPARTSTWSRTTSSCARRLATSGATPPVSRRMNSSFRPATVSPFCFKYSLIALSIWVAVSANWPENGMMSPILMGCCAPAGATASRKTTRLPIPIRVLRIGALRASEVGYTLGPGGSIVQVAIAWLVSWTAKVRVRTSRHTVDALDLLTRRLPRARAVTWRTRGAYRHERNQPARLLEYRPYGLASGTRVAIP